MTSESSEIDRGDRRDPRTRLGFWIGLVASVIGIVSFLSHLLAQTPLEGLGIDVRHGPAARDSARRVRELLVDAGAEVAHTTLQESLPPGTWILCRGTQEQEREEAVLDVLRETDLPDPNRLEPTARQLAAVTADCEVWID